MNDRMKVAKSILMHKEDSNVYVICYLGEAKEEIQEIAETQPCIFADINKEGEEVVIDAIMQVAEEWGNLLESGLSDQADMSLCFHVNNAPQSAVDTLKGKTDYNIYIIDPEDKSVSDIRGEVNNHLNNDVF